MNRATMPVVSVVMPAYNAEKYIKISIESVIEQSFTNWELIVVDDGSTDSTAAVIKDLQFRDDRIKYIYQRNSKLGAARNTGIKSAKGNWVAFLDSDDVWMQEKLQTQLQAVHEAGTDLVFTNGYYLNEASQRLEPYDSLTGRFEAVDLYKILFWHNYIPVLSVMMKKALVEKVGLQDESPRVYGCEDWDYWLRCCRNNASFLGLDHRMFKYRVHDNGMSRDVLAMHSAGFYVLYKNYEPSRFNADERKMVEDKLITQARFIVMESFHTKKINSIPYHLKIISELSKNKLKCRIAVALFFVFRQKSFRFINQLI